MRDCLDCVCTSVTRGCFLVSLVGAVWVWLGRFGWVGLAELVLASLAWWGDGMGGDVTTPLCALPLELRLLANPNPRAPVISTISSES